MFKIIKFVFFGICPSMASLFGVNQKPNIVVFISDDLGRLDTSIHGSKDARTPTMERLAAEGIFGQPFHKVTGLKIEVILSMYGRMGMATADRKSF
jgi:hypothetical protein|tara:strand:+ start:594 stop:881 length:288 start_codon:yes stop_codon:yes gene_type:complete